MNRRSIAIVSLVVIALIAAPIVVLVRLVSQPDRLDDIAADPTPVMMPVSYRTTDDERFASIRASWSEPSVVAAPAWSGVVTAVAIGPGATLSTGDPVVSVNDVTRIAVAGIAPLWRPLSTGATGRDVSDLQRLLTALGHYEGEIAGTYNAATAQAVNTLGVSIGVANAGGVFDPSWVIMLPHEPFDVAETTLVTGSPAPAAGSEILVGPTLLASAEVTDPAGEDLDLDPEVAYKVETRGHVFTLHRGTTSAPTSELGTLALLVGDAEGGVIEARVRRQEPIEVVQVPSSSVMTSIEGSLCVWVAENGSFRPVPVVVEASTVGIAQVSSDLPQGTEVLVNPGTVLDDPSCP